MVRIIGLGEYCISSVPQDSIKTYALASCVGLVAYDIKHRTLGMAHIVLPGNTENDSTLPVRECYYGSTAVPFLLDQVFGSSKPESKYYRILLYGGAISRNDNDVFCIGTKNVRQIEQILNARGLHYDKSNTGGYSSRTIEAFVNDGSVAVRTQKMK